MSAIMHSQSGFNKDQALWLVVIGLVAYLLLSTNFFSRTGLVIQRVAINTYKGSELFLLIILGAFLVWYYWKGKPSGSSNTHKESAHGHEEHGHESEGHDALSDHGSHH